MAAPLSLLEKGASTTSQIAILEHGYPKATVRNRDA
jgi:hypothetical protein